MERFDLYPARLMGDSAYGSVEMLGWLVYAARFCGLRCRSSHSRRGGELSTFGDFVAAESPLTAALALFKRRSIITQQKQRKQQNHTAPAARNCARNDDSLSFGQLTLAIARFAISRPTSFAAARCWASLMTYPTWRRSSPRAFAFSKAIWSCTARHASHAANSAPPAAINPPVRLS